MERIMMSIFLFLLENCVKIDMTFVPEDGDSMFLCNVGVTTQMNVDVFTLKFVVIEMRVDRNEETMLKMS